MTPRADVRGEPEKKPGAVLCAATTPYSEGKAAEGGFPLPHLWEGLVATPTGEEMALSRLC